MSPRKTTLRRPPPPPPPVIPLSLYRKIGVSFIMVTVLLLILVFTVTTARSEIAITVKAVPLQVEVPLTVARAPTGDQVAGNVFEQVVSGEQSWPVSGDGAAEPAKAHGTVTIKNTTARAQPLVATTRLLSKDGVLFKITKSVVAPAGGEVKVEAQADELGKQGEIGPTKFTIPGLATALQDKIYAESFEPMRGGELKSGVVTEEAVAQATQALTASLAESVRGKMTADATAYTGQVFRTDTLERAVSPAVGKPSAEMKIKLKVRVTGAFFDREAALIAARTALASRLTPGTVLKDIPGESMVARLDNASAKDGVAHVTVAALGNTSPQSAAFEVMKARLGGLDRAGVAAVFRDLPGISQVEVKFRPPWVRRAPSNPDHIKIVVQQE